MRHASGIALIVVVLGTTAAAPGKHTQLPRVSSRITVEVTKVSSPYGDSDGARAQAQAYLGEAWMLLPDGPDRVVLAVERTNVPSPATTGVGARFQNGELDLGGGGIHLGYGFAFSWTSLRLRLHDADGDGVLEAGEGTASGHVGGATGDVIQSFDVELRLRAAADATPPILGLRGADESQLLAPVDALDVDFSEPLPWSSVGRALRVRSEAALPEFDVTPTEVGSGLAVGAHFVPREPLPFGVRLTVSADGVYDAAGNAASTRGSRAVMTDPGALSGNPGFERGLQGWAAMGAVDTAARHELDVAPEGGAQARVATGGRLVGYVDVPPGAGTLSFSTAVYSEAGRFDPGHSVVITLSDGANTATAFDAAMAEASSGECACESLGHRIASFTVRANVAPWRGRRLFVSADVRAAGYFGVNYFVLLLDDFRLHEDGQGR